MLTNTSAQRLRLPGYAILAMLIVSQLVEVAVRSSPFRMHSPAWRLGYVSAVAGESSMVLVALFLMLLIAAFAEDRAGAFVIAGACWLLSLLFVVAIALFGLDVLQFRGQVSGALAEQYGVGSAWIAVRMVIAVILFVVLALSSLRLARSFGSRAAAGPVNGSLAAHPRATPTKAVRRG